MCSNYISDCKGSTHSIEIVNRIGNIDFLINIAFFGVLFKKMTKKTNCGIIKEKTN